ncbi:MAG: Flp pilus assembly protein CpaB [Janthinobacterium lividum]
MKFKKAIVFGVALLLAIFGVLLYKILSSSSDNQHKIETAMILVAPAAIQPGDSITVDKLAWKEWPILSINPQYITKEHKAEIKSLDGSVARYPILEGEPINMSNVIKTDGKSILAAVIRPGMRAVSVPYTKIVNAPALISPGDLIDVVIPQRSQNVGTNANYENFVGQTIIRGVRVLAVDDTIQKSAAGKDLTSPKTLTLEVTPQQAELLAVAIPKDAIIISMRSVFGSQNSAQDEYPQSENLTPPPPAPVVKPDRNIAVFRGSERTDVNIK